MRIFLLLALTLPVGSGLANAQTIVPRLDEPGRKGEVARNIKNKAVAQFDAADENKDGKLSKEEVAKHIHSMVDSFDKRDADKDGLLSWEEYLGHNRWPK